MVFSRSMVAAWELATAVDNALKSGNAASAPLLEHSQYAGHWPWLRGSTVGFFTQLALQSLRVVARSCWDQPAWAPVIATNVKRQNAKLRSGAPLPFTSGISIPQRAIVSQRHMVYMLTVKQPRVIRPVPKASKGQKRPADVIGNPVKVVRIATGEEAQDFPADDGKDKAAQSLGRRGGRARAQALSKKRRVEIARKAAAKRWGA
jgi:hypothetical protein